MDLLDKVGDERRDLLERERGRGPGWHRHYKADRAEVDAKVLMLLTEAQVHATLALGGDER